jgi:hypothetical protein
MKQLWFVVPAAALAFAAGPVGARTTKTACGQKSACVWTDPTFQGRMAQVPARGCIDSSIRSAVNNSGRTIYLFTGSGCYGPRAGALQPGEETPEISAGSATGNCTTAAGDPCGDDPTVPPEPPA